MRGGFCWTLLHGINVSEEVRRNGDEFILDTGLATPTLSSAANIIISKAHYLASLRGQPGQAGDGMEEGSRPPGPNSTESS